MDMNKDESVQYVTMKECSHQEEPLLYETLCTTSGKDIYVLCAHSCTVCSGGTRSCLLVHFLLTRLKNVC